MAHADETRITTICQKHAAKEVVPMKKAISVLSILLALTVLLSACVQESVVPTEPTSSQTTETPTGPTTEPTAEQIYTLADLDFNQMHYSGGTPEGYYPFICADDKKERTLEWILEKNTDEVVQLLKDFTPGYVYLMDIDTQEFICIIDEPMIAKHDTSDYLFCITAENTLIVTDMTGTVRVELYRAVEPLGVKSLGYWRTSLYFIEGSSIMNMDLLTGEIKKLIEYEGAIDADPLYGIDEEFPHLMLIKTETDDVACNLETGETAIIPETGQWGTAAFDQYLGYGVWPETEPPTEPLTDVEYFQQLLAYSNGYTGNGYNAALNCTFEKPEDLDLGRFFWSHFETHDNWEHLTDEEVAFLNSKGWTNEVDLNKYSAETMDWALQKYFGLPLSAFQDPPMVYYEETNCYYTTGTSPLISHLFEVTEVEYGEDGIVKVYYLFDPQNELMGKYVLTLQEKQEEGETGYYILSHLPVDYGPRQEGQRLTAEDLERFEKMFARNGDNYSFPPPNYYNMALSHTYETVEEMQISTFFNDGCGDNLGEELTQEEYDFFCNKIGFEISKDIIRYPADEVKWVLDYYLGKTPEEVKVGMVYNPNTDCYYKVPAGAFTMPSMYLHFHDGYFDPETGKVSLYYYFYVNDEERVITLQSKEWVGEAGYYIVSNVAVSSQD